VKVEAKVVKLQFIEDSSGSVDNGPDYDNSQNLVTYAFEVGAGSGRRRYEREERVQDDVFRRLNEGQNIPIRYDPADPNIARLESDLHNNEGTGILLFFAALFWLGALWGFAYWQVMVRWPTRRLIREGRVVRGEVVTCQGRLDGDDFTVVLDYRFVAPDGRPIADQKTAERNDLKGAALPGPGSPVLVFCFGSRIHQIL
jgi:hypothetical protein